MNDMLPGLKNDKENLPFDIPGQVSYLDFSGPRFQSCDSKVFIRPVFYMQVSLPAQTVDFCLPCTKDCCFLLYIKEGTGHFEDDGEYFDLSAGSGLLSFSETPMSFRHRKGPITCRILYISGELLWELKKVQEKTIVSFSKYQYPDFEERLDSLMGEYLRAEMPLLFVFSRHMDHLLSRIIRYSIQEKYDKAKDRKQSLMQAITYMKEHCCEEMQVGDIAAAFGYSSSHFSRIFQNEFHQSPKKYLLGLRIAHAEKLLETSELSVEAIGQECGFNTTTHFIQIFRDVHAMTPLQYRKKAERE